MKSNTVQQSFDRQPRLALVTSTTRSGASKRKPRRKASTTASAVHPCGEFFRFRTLQRRLAQVSA